MKRKGIAALLTMSMVLAAGGTGGAVVSAAEDPVTFKVAVMLNPLCKDEDFNNQEAYKKAEEATGVHIEWIPISSADADDKVNIMLASDLPDAFLGLIGEGQIANNMDSFLDLNKDDLLKTNAPHVVSDYEKLSNGLDIVTWPDGSIRSLMSGRQTSYENDAEGIGLFRSEFLYLGCDDYPSEEVQFEAYKTVLSRMNGKKVIIRTMDIGADKQIDYFNLPKEDNPALGYRAIRICLTREDIFRTQLRALYRASAYGTLSIMFPMIISVKEITRIKEIVEEVKLELAREEQPMGEVELGIMIETPAAAVISDLLAPHVDFFSIGTNDLSQYTLAIDRQNQSLDSFFDPHHEAILRLIQLTIENAHKYGAWCGICGELGADMELTAKFIQMGIDELSVSPGYTLELRKRIREC